jgi:signal transduction histidine kinase
MNRIAIACLLVTGLFTLPAKAQEDTVTLLHIYDRVLEFPETKADSAAIYAHRIEERSKELNWATGRILSHRLYGISNDLRGDYRMAIDHYLACLDLARKLQNTDLESSALSDLGYDHYLINNFKQSKDYFLESARVAQVSGTPQKLITRYSNLGAAYNTLNMTDSALYYFNLALDRAHRIHKTSGLASLRNNIGNAWFRRKEYEKALPFFRENADESERNEDFEEQWVDNLNIGDVFVELKRYDSARIYIAHSMEIARKLASRRKEADVEKLYAKYYSRTGEFRNAFEALSRWQAIDSAYVNEQTRNTMLELEQKFHAKEREAQNQLLQARVDQEVLRNRVISLLALAIFGIALAVGISRYLIRRKNRKLEEQNDLIQAQNQRLAELNSEKNSLISVVSHDLSGPFTTIRMWLQLMDKEQGNLTVEQLKALDRIQQSAENGEKLIRNILVVERAETNRHLIDIESFNLQAFLEEMMKEYTPQAEKKDIALYFKGTSGPVNIMGDRQLTGRIFGNLLSNAIKFTPAGKSVHLSLADGGGNVTVTVRDEGVGIPADEIDSLFTKYAKITSRPTAGEASTGLGLSIVKRLVEELGGDIYCSSEEGKGSLFTVTLKK